MSRSAFSHFFRARTDSTPARFMMEIRVQMATRLLATTHRPLDRIAHECGFANAKHLGKVFRRLRHQSTGAYRRAAWAPGPSGESAAYAGAAPSNVEI